MSAKVLFSFDLTSSMAPCYHELRRALSQTLTRLFRDIPGLEVALIAHGDYYDARDYYVTKTMDFTNDGDALVKFAQTVTTTHGGDAPECYELVLQQVQDMDWGDADKKVLVMIGDATPHEVGYVYDGHRYDIDWKVEASKVSNLGISIYAVQCLGYRGNETFWKTIGKYGHYLDLAHFSDIVSLFEATCFSQGSNDQLIYYAAELARTGKMNRSMAAIMDKLLGKKAVSKAMSYGDSSLEAVDPHRFQVLHVDSRTPIKQFVTENGARFRVGRGFYSFTKTETIQAYKEVVLRDKETGDMFTGEKARELAGLPIGENCRMRPGDCSGYDVFVQSMSVNRVLMPGTLFLYDTE